MNEHTRYNHGFGWFCAMRRHGAFWIIAMGRLGCETYGLYAPELGVFPMRDSSTTAATEALAAFELGA